jgi:hypothetical protein
LSKFTGLIRRGVDYDSANFYQLFVMAYEQERQVAIQAATLAAQLCQQVRQTMVPEAIQKQDKSPVTVGISVPKP